MSPFFSFLERRLLAVTASVCLLAVTATLVWLLLTLPGRVDARLQGNLVDASWNLRDATWQLAQAGRDLHSVSSSLADPRSGVDRTLRNINIVTAQVGRASNVARLASDEQRDALRDISGRALATLNIADSLLAGANRNLNDGVLPSLTADLGEVRNSMQSLTADSHRMLASSTNALDRAAALLGDQSWARAALHLSGASSHLEGAAANTEQTLGYVRDMFRPNKIGFWRSLGGAIVRNAAGPVAGALVERLWKPQVEVVNTVKTQNQQ